MKNLKNLFQVKKFQLINEFVLIKTFNFTIDKIYNELKAAEILYPNFKEWFYNKVVLDLLTNKRKNYYRKGESKLFNEFSK